MADIVGLVLPLFGLILLGFGTASVIRQPAGAMGWLRIFIIYLALLALFFKLLSKTPVEQLANCGFVLINLAPSFPTPPFKGWRGPMATWAIWAQGWGS